MTGDTKEGFSMLWFCGCLKQDFGINAAWCPTVLLLISVADSEGGRGGNCPSPSALMLEKETQQKRFLDAPVVDKTWWSAFLGALPVDRHGAL